MDDSELSALLHQINHDLKTPLTSLKLSNSMLLEEKIGELNDKQKLLLSNSVKDIAKLEEFLAALIERYQ